MRRCKAVFMGKKPERIAEVYTPEQRSELAGIAELLPEAVTPENFDRLDLSQVEAIFSTWGMMCLTPEQLDRMPKLEAVFYAAGATDAFARPLLSRGIHLSSAWRANAVPVAEFVLAQIVLSMKNYFAVTSSLRRTRAWSKALVGPGCYGECVALLGAGEISTRLSRMLANFDLEVLTVPSRPERRTVPLEEAFRRAFVVSNHLPNREDNRKVLTRDMFLSMRPHATFINTGRGAQVDEPGLIEALKARPDLTALIDVTFPEPPETDSELYALPNVHLTPHIAGSLNDEVHRMARFAIDEYKRYANGEALEHEVVEEMLMTH